MVIVRHRGLDKEPGDANRGQSVAITGHYVIEAHEQVPMGEDRLSHRVVVAAPAAEVFELD